jgi:DNA modification methylase
MYVFSGWNNLKDILNALDEIGFTTVNHIIWKYQFGVVTRRKFTTSHYHCIYACKDDRLRRFFPFSRHDKDAADENGRSLHYRDKEDVWVIKREYWNGDQKTPTKLPRELVEKILKYSSQEGDLVLDPFLGSGQVAVVSKMLGRRYLGFEIVKEYAEFARERLTSGLYRIAAENAKLGEIGDIILVSQASPSPTSNAPVRQSASTLEPTAGVRRLRSPLVSDSGPAVSRNPGPGDPTLPATVSLTTPRTIDTE